MRVLYSFLAHGGVPDRASMSALLGQRLLAFKVDLYSLTCMTGFSMSWLRRKDMALTSLQVCVSVSPQIQSLAVHFNGCRRDLLITTSGEHSHDLGRVVWCVVLFVVTTLAERA